MNNNNNKSTTKITWLQETPVYQIPDLDVAFCKSWHELLTDLKVDAPMLLIIDFSMFQITEMEISEVVNMMHSFVKCISTDQTIKIAVAIDKKCTNKTIKELQQNKILGIVPNDEYFGGQQLSTAIAALLQGKAHWPTSILSNLKQTTATTKGTIRLTTRQNQVLELVGNRGLTNKKIATILGISESTVKIHVSAILKEFGVRNRTQLALAASSKLRA